MYKVTKEWNVTKDLYLLTLNKKKPLKSYWKYKIGKKEYEPVIVYDMGDKVICVHGSGGFMGKTVEFI